MQEGEGMVALQVWPAHSKRGSLRLAMDMLLGLLVSYHSACKVGIKGLGWEVSELSPSPYSDISRNFNLLIYEIGTAMPAF